MYTNILYPTDGSSGANAALEHARELAVGYDATLHVLFVIDAEHIETGMMPRAEDSEHRRITGMMKRDEETKGEGSMLPNEDIGKKLERRGGQLTEEIASVLSDEGCETVPVVREGDPASIITEYAETNDIDLITMGTHGRSGLKRRLIGSVTETVVRTSAVPVLTVRLDGAAPQE